jgi:hypothetical protein
LTLFFLLSVAYKPPRIFVTFSSIVFYVRKQVHILSNPPFLRKSLPSLTSVSVTKAEKRRQNRNLAVSPSIRSIAQTSLPYFNPPLRTDQFHANALNHGLSPRQADAVRFIRRLSNFKETAPNSRSRCFPRFFGGGTTFSQRSH